MLSFILIMTRNHKQSVLALLLLLVLTTVWPSIAFATENQQAKAESAAETTGRAERFVGKTLVFDTGKVVGPILNLVRRPQDSKLYLVIDATEFFNQSVEYVVPLEDVEKIEVDTVVLPMAPGDHLRGMVYYADDYEAVGN